MHEELYDIYPVWHVPFWQRSEFYWTVYLLVGLIICIIAVLVIRWCFPHKKSLRSWEIALSQLNELEKEQPTISVERLYTRLTQIIKEYISHYYTIPCTYQTDNEFIFYIKNKQLDPLLAKDLETLFEGAILSKFAHTHSIDEHIKKDIEVCKQFIKKTIARPKT